MSAQPALQDGPGSGPSGPDLLPARRRRLPLEFLLGGVALLVCAGALVGPQVYRGVVAGRLVRSMGEHFGSGDYPAATRLMELGWPESEAALRRFAESLPMGAYLPGERALAAAAPGLGFRLPVPRESGRDAEQFTTTKVDCCLQFGGSFEGYFLGARPTALAAEGDRVGVSFVLDAAVARRLGLPAGESRRATLSLKELRRVASGGSTVMADYDTKPPERIWKQVLDGLAPLLRTSGLVEPRGGATNSLRMNAPGCTHLSWRSGSFRGVGARFKPGGRRPTGLKPVLFPCGSAGSARDRRTRYLRQEALARPPPTPPPHPPPPPPPTMKIPADGLR